MALLQGSLGHIQAGAAELEPVVEACRRQPCLVHIAGRALAQGCLSLQALLNNGSGKVPTFLAVALAHICRHHLLYVLGLVLYAGSEPPSDLTFAHANCHGDRSV